MSEGRDAAGRAGPTPPPGPTPSGSTPRPGDGTAGTPPASPSVGLGGALSDAAARERVTADARRTGERTAARLAAGRRRAGRGYIAVCVAYLIMGSIGALVDWTTAPESALLVIRFVTAGVVLGIVFARRQPLAGIRGPGVPVRLLAMGVVDAVALLLFFVAMRDTSVAIGMFLEFMAPVWVAVLAPRVFRVRTEPVVYVALIIAVAGLTIILAPMLLGEGVKVSWVGVIAGTVSGLLYACFQMTVKSLTNRGVGATTVVISESVLNSLILLPLALWQTIGAGYELTRKDLFVGIFLGVVCTALAYTLWTEGMSRVRVQHVSILGYLEPVSAPLYAFLLIGEHPSVWTLVGGAVIIVAGVLVIVFGERDAAVAAPPS